MSIMSVQFAHINDFSLGWLLLLVIPLIGLSLIPYFRSGKKYRRTRNRIVSLVLHCLTILLVTLALSGVTIVRTVSNTANELILLVDVSNTQTEAAERRDNFIDDLLKESVYQGFSVGVVTFGFDQVYAVPMTSNAGSVFEDYLEAELPDTSATDIESALEYARTLFTHPESGKIVLITDGKETDGNAVSSASVSAIVAQGTILDTVYISSSYEEEEFQILNVETPDVQIKKNVECSISVSVYSNNEGYARLNLFDNDRHVEVGRGEDKTDNYTVKFTTGLQSFSLPYAFTEDGMHELKVEIERVDLDGAKDGMGSNNAYYTYYDVKAHKKVLVFEAFDGESEELGRILKDTEMLGEGEEYEVSIYNLRRETLVRYGEDEPSEEGKVPQSVNDLRAYDQVILNNISNADLIRNEDGSDRDIPLDQLLYSYVYDFGGGMLTLGGSEPGSDPEKPTEHAYNRRDMYGTDFQRMLPVEAIDYSPPVGVFIIVDVSGSMGSDSEDESSYLYWAKVGAGALVGALSERDQIGILTLGDNYEELLPLTPTTRKKEIEAGIGKIEAANSGTQFLPSIRYAAEQLRAAQMEKNHIIIVSDCEVTDNDMAGSENFVRDCYLDPRLNLTVSVVNVSPSSDSSKTECLVLATREDGWVIDGEPGCGYYHLTDDNDEIVKYMMQDVKSPLISEVERKPFQPIILNPLSQVVQGIERGEDVNTVNATLKGFYGVKRKDSENVDLVLTGDYQVPVYARWKYGKGSVGSFMCDLKGSEWSLEFMNSAVGKQLVYNIVDDLMPAFDIAPQDINLTLKEQNYSNHLTCPTELKEGESLRGKIVMPDGTEVSLNQTGAGDGWIVKRGLSAANRYSVCDFIITKSGIYTIVIEKVDAEGNVSVSASVVKEFSYSKEYDVEYDKTEEELRATLGLLALNGKGTAIDETANVEDVFKEFITKLTTVYDPRLLLVILAILLFLLDVAVRKFKFKWIHELIREKREKKQNGQIRMEERHEQDK